MKETIYYNKKSDVYFWWDGDTRYILCDAKEKIDKIKRTKTYGTSDIKTIESYIKSNGFKKLNESPIGRIKVNI